MNLQEQLKEVAGKLEYMKKTGEAGLTLLIKFQKMIDLMQDVVKTFEKKTNYKSWQENMKQILTPEQERQLFEIYQLLKQILQKLGADQ